AGDDRRTLSRVEDPRPSAHRKRHAQMRPNAHRNLGLADSPYYALPELVTQNRHVLDGCIIPSNALAILFKQLRNKHRAWRYTHTESKERVGSKCADILANEFAVDIVDNQRLKSW